jgi:uracil phosphoribosyltransferase
MQVTNVDHPLVTERLTRLRDKTTKRAEFRRNLEELTAFLVYEAMRDYPVVPIEIDTPMAPTRGVQVAEPPLVVPVMRAGLGMLHATLDVVPNARVGFIGLKRDEETPFPSSSAASACWCSTRCSPRAAR